MVGGNASAHFDYGVWGVGTEEAREHVEMIRGGVLEGGIDEALEGATAVLGNAGPGCCGWKLL